MPTSWKKTVAKTKFKYATDHEGVKPNQYMRSSAVRLTCITDWVVENAKQSSSSLVLAYLFIPQRLAVKTCYGVNKYAWEQSLRDIKSTDQPQTRMTKNCVQIVIHKYQADSKHYHLNHAACNWFLSWFMWLSSTFISTGLVRRLRTTIEKQCFILATHYIDC